MGLFLLWVNPVLYLRDSAVFQRVFELQYLLFTLVPARFGADAVPILASVVSAVSWTSEALALQNPRSLRNYCCL